MNNKSICNNCSNKLNLRIIRDMLQWDDSLKKHISLFENVPTEYTVCKYTHRDFFTETDIIKSCSAYRKLEEEVE